nr:INSYN2B protein-like [Zootoca vivipara]
MASQGAALEAGQEKAAAAGVRSVLLKRDSPGAEDRLQRRHRARQVRFKDLEEGGEKPLGSPTPRASAANCARRSWPQSGPRLLLALPDPHGATGISTASQTSPSLQRPLRSKSSCDLAQEGAPSAVGRNQDPPPGGTASLPALGCSLASPHTQQRPRLPATLCPGLPPPRGSCPPYPGRGEPCLLASCSSQRKHCAPSSMQPLGSSGAPWLCQLPLCQTPSEQASRAPPCAPQRSTPSPNPLSQGPPTQDPTPACLLPAAGPPKSAKPAAPGASPESLSTTQAHPTAPTPSQKPPDPLLPSSRSSCPPEACLSAQPGGTFPCVQDHHLQLVSVAEGPPCPAAAEREPPPASQDLPRRVGEIHSQLQSLEGVLETSQRTIKVLLDVIQDLEKKEAQRDGRQSYRTGQDTTNCGTCRNSACIIYSVEHDFRKQEGRLQQVLSTIEPEPSHSPPGARPAATPNHQEPSPALNLAVVKAEPKKSRRKCFWFL